MENSRCSSKDTGTDNSRYRRLAEALRACRRDVGIQAIFTACNSPHSTDRDREDHAQGYIECESMSDDTGEPIGSNLAADAHSITAADG